MKQVTVGPWTHIALISDKTRLPDVTYFGHVNRSSMDGVWMHVYPRVGHIKPVKTRTIYISVEARTILFTSSTPTVDCYTKRNRRRQVFRFTAFMMHHILLLGFTALWHTFARHSSLGDTIMYLASRQNAGDFAWDVAWHLPILSTHTRM